MNDCNTCERSLFKYKVSFGIVPSKNPTCPPASVSNNIELELFSNSITGILTHGTNGSSLVFKLMNGIVIRLILPLGLAAT